ncbi:hypothetical protein V6U81_26725 [Micromonospora sp. CPCC 205711]|uniref:hypothetical protein n=1 Tax=Micromonospora sp. CPCC 205547 TaxID=3122400 RepID=UPI002FEEF5CB
MPCSFPGKGYDTRFPLFAYTREALRRGGFTVQETSWQAPDRFGPDRDGLTRRLTPHVLEIPDAGPRDDGAGPLARSAEVLGRVCTAVEEFVQIS